MRYLLTAFSMKVMSDTTLLCSRPHGVEALSDDARLTSVAYIRPKSRTESARKTKIDIEVAHVTRDSDTTFKIKKSKVKVTGAGHIVLTSHTACSTGATDGSDNVHEVPVWLIDRNEGITHILTPNLGCSLYTGAACTLRFYGNRPG